MQDTPPIELEPLVRALGIERVVMVTPTTSRRSGRPKEFVNDGPAC